jgi:hypothetical protein
VLPRAVGLAWGVGDGLRRLLLSDVVRHGKGASEGVAEGTSSTERSKEKRKKDACKFGGGRRSACGMMDGFVGNSIALPWAAERGRRGQ